MFACLLTLVASRNLFGGFKLLRAVVDAVFEFGLNSSHRDALSFRLGATTLAFGVVLALQMYKSNSKSNSFRT